MLITRLDKNTVVLSQLDLLCTELIRQIAATAEPGDNTEAQARLYPAPTGGREPEADRDWREYVEPDLRRLFQDAREIVEQDLRTLAPEPAGHRLRLPVKHLEAWIHALNQARLTIAARHGFSERDIDARIPMQGGPRSQALFQLHFYGFLQECFLRELG